MAWPMQWLFKYKLLHFCLKAKKIWQMSDWNRKGVPNVRTLVENCKLLEICTTQMHSHATLSHNNQIIQYMIKQTGDTNTHTSAGGCYLDKTLNSLNWFEGSLYKLKGRITKLNQISEMTVTLIIFNYF